MRIAIVSDIHGNRRAFQAVMADLNHASPDLILHGGDLASGGAHPAEIVDQIRGLGWPGVRGNTDEMLWSLQSLSNFAARQPKLQPLLGKIQATIPPTVASLGPDRLQWLQSLPAMHTFEQITLLHAGPNDLWRAPMANATNEELRTTYLPLNSGIVVYGHIHAPYIRRLPELTVANTGSVSQSYDGDRRASYLVIDGDQLTTRRVEYDVEGEVEDLLNSGIPHADWMAKILLAGKYVPPD